METFFIVLLYVVILACTVDSVLNTIFSNLQRRYKDEILQSNATLKKGLDDFISLLREAEAERIIASALSAQAARIKELEEALGLCLPHVQTDCWRFCEPKATVTVEKSKSGRTWDLVEPIARTKAKAALDGARKAGPK